MQGPTIRAVGQLRHALSAMLEATAVMVRQRALYVMLEGITLRMAASLYQPACIVQPDHTACKEVHPALSAMLEATAVVGSQPALIVIPATTIPLQEARLRLPVFHAI